MLSNLNIKIPANNIEERSYIIKIIIEDFLGLSCNLILDAEETNYVICFDEKQIIFKDKFFNIYPKDFSYLDNKNLPSKVLFFKNLFLFDEDIPVIFGDDELRVENNKIICGIDIFASSFFMLTRWEEYVNLTRDEHNRFPGSESLAYKNNFLHRPVVNEYVEMLKNILLYFNNDLKLSTTNYQLFLTHDVDTLCMWKNWKQVFKVALGDIIKRKNINLSIERIAKYLLIIRKKINDPYDTFDWLMDKSEAIGIKSRFYFMSGGTSFYDNYYKVNAKNTLDLMQKIRKREHIIGFHPSYNAYNNFQQFKNEKDILEKTFKQKILEGREHYLRFEIPTTWQIWEDNGLEIDGTCGYADKEGFRCGTGDEFSVFNFLKREKLKLKERPLIIMEGTLKNYQNLDIKQSETIYHYYIDISKKYKMKISMLFHNSSFVSTSWKGWDRLYEQIINYSSNSIPYL
ncbi:MAG: polysaccharide deacetylase family protein [Fusobacteriaceae bacterium]|jgi:hypothetical protein|nr:polysaccharide deacetylase family protein [Fusobacteriaceae bacterium]